MSKPVLESWGKGHISNGHTPLPEGYYFKLESDRQILDYYFQMFMRDEMGLKISSKKIKRSNAQNALYWLKTTAAIKYWYDIHGDILTKKQVHQIHLQVFLNIVPEIKK